MVWVVRPYRLFCYTTNKPYKKSYGRPICDGDIREFEDRSSAEAYRKTCPFATEIFEQTRVKESEVAVDG